MLERTTERNAIPVRDVIQRLKTWQVEHGPFDRSTRLNLFQFVVEEGKGGALVPLASADNVNSVTNLPTIYMKPHAMKQYLTRLEYPPKLYDRLSPKLNVFNLNWLVQHGGYEKGVLFRVQDGNEMRVMSDYYSPMDTLDVLTMAEPMLTDGLVWWSFDDELTFHMSVSFPSTQTELKVGDIVEQGIHISNSEVGVRSVTIAAYVYRLRCKNGAIGCGDGDVFRFRHVGSGDRLREMVGAAIQSTKLEATRILAQFKDAMTVAIAQPFEYLEKQFKERNLTQEQLKASLDALMGEPEKGNLFGISQSVSAAAQRFEGEQSYELQRTAVAISGGFVSQVPSISKVTQLYQKSLLPKLLVLYYSTMVDAEKRGREAAISGFAHEHIVAGILMKRYGNVSLVDLPLSPYDIVIVFKTEQGENIIRAQVKTAQNSVSFTGGSRGGVDREYVSDVKIYRQSPKTCDVVIGVHPRDPDTYDLYFVPTLLIEKLSQASISLSKIMPLKNNYEMLDHCKDSTFVTSQCQTYGLLPTLL